MATRNFYGIYYAKCVVVNNIVTGYTGGRKQLGYAKDVTFSRNKNSAEPLCAGGYGAVEHDKLSTGGTLSTGLAHLSMDVEAELFGQTVETASVTVGQAQVSGSVVRDYGTHRAVPVGTAFVLESQVNDTPLYEVVMYRSVRFNPVDVTAKVIEGGKMAWQTPSLSGTVDGQDCHGTNPWRTTATFPTLEASLAYIDSIFGEPAGGTVNEG